MMQIVEGAADRRAGIPRADLLTYVAAENMRAHGLAKFLRDRSAQLDGEVSDAPPGVDRPGIAGGDERIRRAGVDAARAGAAAVRGRRIGRDFKRSDQLAQKKPRT